MTDDAYVQVINRLHDEALKAMADSIRVAADESSAAAVEFIANYLNNHDAVEDEDIKSFDRWLKRGKP